MLPRLSRRHWLIGSASFVVAARGWAAESTGATVSLSPRDDHEDFRVRMEVKMEGNIKIARPKTAQQADEPIKLPMKADAIHEYHERVTRDGKNAVAARRRYSEAKSEGTVHRDAIKLALRSQAREIGVRMIDGRMTCFSDEYLLTSDEIELLKAPLVSFAAERLLPADPMIKGATWKVPSEATIALLDLDSVQEGELLGRVASFDAKVAKLEFTGKITGQIASVDTTMTVAAKAQFDRVHQCVTWMATSIKEERAIGKGEPGFEITAQTQMIREPIARGDSSVKAEPIVLDQPTTADRLYVDLRGASGFSLLADRSWKIIADSSRLTVLRMVKQDQIIAQCEFRPLTSLKEGEQLTLEAFQNDVRQALGKQFGEFLDAEERVTESKVRVLRTSIQGTVSETPVMWSYLHFSDDSGQRIAATFTMDAQRVEQFAAADAQIASSFQFYRGDTEAQPAETAKPATGTASKPAEKSLK